MKKQNENIPIDQPKVTSDGEGLPNHLPEASCPFAVREASPTHPSPDTLNFIPIFSSGTIDLLKDTHMA